MEERRPGAGELVAGASGALLLAATFLPWYGLDSAVALPGRPEGVTVHGEGLNAWRSFAGIDVVLLVAALAAMALPLLSLARVRTGQLPLLVAAAGAICALLVVLRLLDPPDLAGVADTAVSETGRRIGPFFALVAAMGISWGGWRALEPQAEPVQAPEPEPEPAPAGADRAAPAATPRAADGPPIRSAGVAAFDEMIAQMEPLLMRLWDAPSAPRGEHASIPAAPGVYLFSRQGEPVHVGEAADLRRRLAEQCRPSSGHTKATLAFAIARRAARREGIDVDGPPARLATSDAFAPYFTRAKETVAELPVRFLEVESAEVRTVFKVYVSLALGTAGDGTGAG